MSRSMRRPQQLFAVVMWLLSFAFAAALLGLGSLVIADLPRVGEPVRLEQFVDAQDLARIRQRENEAAAATASLSRQVEDARTAYASAAADYSSAKASFDNWLATRTATQQNAQNPQVLARQRLVDELQLRQRETLAALEQAQVARTANARLQQDLRNERFGLEEAAGPAFESAQRWETLKVFLFRLAITLPLLVVAGYFAAKKRESAYWPLYRGFIIFALFAFFVELVPYLPSYGGYVRYIVAIALALIVGHYAIKAMNRYLARKREEESRSEAERRSDIDYETALKKIGAKTCPGCDRKIEAREDVDTFFCVHCGIRLRRKCGACGETNISFHHYCLSCGTPMAEDASREPTPALAPT